jgi:hypothetical protein
MRRFGLLLFLLFGTTLLVRGQACTGLCLQQVACTGGGTTSISGTVYAPNGTDPLPNVLVFIPNAALSVMTPGVTCPVPGAVPDGAPLVGTTTAPDGTFHLDNVPVGTSIPLVIQSGRWRRQLTVPTTTACTDTAFSTRMPTNQSEGDIPQFAIATGSADEVECVLRKVGVADAEFTNPLSTGRIHLYGDVSARGGAIIDANTPLQSTLMSNLAALQKYDVLMLPCEGGQYIQPASELSNLVQYANIGGRVYASHFSYVWMYNNPPFNTVANWAVNQATLPDGLATVNASFSGASALSAWLQTVGASTTPGQIILNTNKHDLNGVVAPTQAWITLNDAAAGNPVMQLTFNTPVGATNQCGRVLFNEYHVETRPTGTTPYNKIFPTECTGGPLTAQEKLLEYSLFDLTNSGGPPTMTPSTMDFGTEYLGFTTPAQTFKWTNNSIFAASVSTATATGDFAVVSNTCSNVASGASCTIGVVFKPTVVGPEAGTLSVVSNGTTLTASLTGTGAQALVLSTSSLTFGNTDVGASVTQGMTVHNAAPAAIPITGVAITGDYTLANGCSSTLAAGATCALQITFTPTTTGTRSGQVSVSGQTASLTGNGVDFSTAFPTATGSVIGGLAVTPSISVLPIAGFSAAVTLKCTTTAPGSTCTVNTGSVVPSPTAGVTITITTTAQYGVIGFGGLGFKTRGIGGLLALLALSSAGLMWRWRDHAAALRRSVWMLVAFTVVCGLLSGCGGKTPAANAVYTIPGPYAYTVMATDGFLTHSATYTLTVTSK